MTGNFDFVFIDDDPEESQDELFESLGRKSVWVARYPDDLRDSAGDAEEKLRRCKVLLMDLEIRKDRRWSLDPLTGQALAENIRGFLAGEGNPLEADKTAFVLFSWLLDRLSDGLPVSGREHVLARKSGNEWVLDKTPEKRPEAQRNLKVLSDLAKAVGRIATHAPDDQLSATRPSFKLLGINNPDAGDWRSSAADDAERLGLPVQSLVSGHSMSLVRWLLHIALPFPGVFSELRDLAVALRLAPEMVRKDKEFCATLKNSLKKYQYKGILSEFQGIRWWRAGVNDFVDTLNMEAEEKNIGFEKILERKFGNKVNSIDRIEVTDPVLVVDECFRRTDDYRDVSETVRIMTEDWPDEVATPRIDVNIASRVKRIRELVRPEDIYRLQ